jgi:cell division protein FtsB
MNTTVTLLIMAFLIVISLTMAGFSFYEAFRQKKEVKATKEEAEKKEQTINDIKDRVTQANTQNASLNTGSDTDNFNNSIRQLHEHARKSE